VFRVTEILWVVQKFWTRCFGLWITHRFRGWSKISGLGIDVYHGSHTDRPKKETKRRQTGNLASSKNSGIWGSRLTEILCTVQIFWTICFRSHRLSVKGPEFLDLVYSTRKNTAQRDERFCERSRNSGIVVLINRDSVNVPEILQ
jgi:hypothetical protein